MNLVLITPYVPYPLTEGGKVSQYAVIDRLRKSNNITLVVDSRNQLDENAIRDLSGLWPDVNIHTVNLVEEKLKGYNSLLRAFYFKCRMGVRKIKRFLSLSLTGAIVESDTRLNELEDDYLINVYSAKSRGFINRLYQIISDCKPDIIQIDLIDYIDIVLCLPPEIKKIFVHHEIRFDRLQSALDAGNIIPSVYDKYI